MEQTTKKISKAIPLTVGMVLVITGLFILMSDITITSKKA